MKASEKLILRSRGQPNLQRSMFALITLLAWTVYAYLWLPLVTALLWVFGLRSAHVQLYLQQQSVDFPLIFQLLGIAATCAIVLIGWAEYNRIRFQGHDRRAHIPHASLDEIAAPLGVSNEHARLMQQARVLRLVMTDEARPIDVHVSERVLDRPAIAPRRLEAAMESA